MSEKTVTGGSGPIKNTKAIAARIPFDKYLELQREAVELKMNMNDYLTFRLFNDRNILLSRFQSLVSRMLLDMAQSKLKLAIADSDDEDLKLITEDDIMDQIMKGLRFEYNSEFKEITGANI